MSSTQSQTMNNKFEFKNPSLLQTNPFVYGSFHECEVDFPVDLLSKNSLGLLNKFGVWVSCTENRAISFINKK